MTRLIDNMERQHLVVRIADKRDRRTNFNSFDQNRQRIGRQSTFHRKQDIERSTARINIGRTESQPRCIKKGIHQHQRLKFFKVFIFFS